MKKKLPLLAVAYILGAFAAVVSFAVKVYTHATTSRTIIADENCRGGIKKRI